MKRTNLAFVATAVALAASGGTLGAVPVAERQEPDDAAARTTPPAQRAFGGIPRTGMRWAKDPNAKPTRTRRPKAERKQRRAARRQRGKR
jgi:hypothetical protein